jgi:hypothetical protein
MSDAQTEDIKSSPELKLWQAEIEDNFINTDNIVTWYWKDEIGMGRSFIAHYIADKYHNDARVIDGTLDSQKFYKELLRELDNGWSGKYLIFDLHRGSNRSRVLYKHLDNLIGNTISFKWTNKQLTLQKILILSPYPPRSSWDDKMSIKQI